MFLSSCQTELYKFQGAVNAIYIIYEYKDWVQFSNFNTKLIPRIPVIHCKDMRRCTWWRHQMETFSVLLAICAGNSPGIGEFPTQRPVTQSFPVFFDLRLNKRLSKQSWGWWFETISHPLWRRCNVIPRDFWISVFLGFRGINYL